MTELETALTTLNDTEKSANINIDEIPSRLRGGWESKKRDAQAQLDDVRRRYQDALGKVIFGVMVLGPGSDAFTKIAAEEAEVLTVDGAEIYKRIASRVTPAMGNSQEFGVSHFGLVIQELRQIAAELNIAEMPSPKWLEPVSVGSPEGLMKHIRTMVDSTAGAGLLRLYISKQITDGGVKAQVSKSTIPVLVTGLSQEMANAVSPGLFQDNRVVYANTTEEVTKEDVLNTFNQVKSQIKRNKKTN